MHKGKLLDLLMHPAFLSLVVWLALVIVIPTQFSKYRVKFIKDEYTTGKTSYFYNDLDSDGNSERISIDLNDQEQTKVIVAKNDKILDQYDLRYQPCDVNQAYFGDYNNDGFKECYIFTLSQDSIFLNIIEPIKTREIILSGRFIDLKRKAKNSDNAPQIYPVDIIEGRNRDCGDLIFYIATGYSRQPRNLYRYLIKEDSLIKSPESGAVIDKCIISDINGDSLSEFILSVRAPGNLDETFPYSDQYSWLMVMDNNLKFLFPPKKIGENPSSLQVIPFQIKNKKHLFVFYDYYGSSDIQSFFCLLDANGNRIKEKIINDYEPIFSGIFPNNNRNGQSVYFLKNLSSEIVEIDSSFEEIHTLKIPQVINGDDFIHFDVDFDGKKEYILYGISERSLIFVRDNFKYPVSWQHNSNGFRVFISQFLKSGVRPMLYLQFRDYGSFIRYEKNPFYYLKFPFYLALYLIILLFITIIGNFQRYRLNLKKENEMKMVSLQMKAIKNQIDPHFTLNVLNAIGSLYSDENNREKADYIFGKYAKLIRQTVINSDQITVPIDEELDFVKNYIEIEKFRSGNSFKYSINIDEKSNTQTKIPRTLIHTFVENAIKYGVRRRTEGGILNIDIQTINGILNIIIEDNGTGSSSQGSSMNGTGKGLIILQELIDLYYRLENVKITYTLQNITQKENTISGTKAFIKIPLK